MEVELVSLKYAQVAFGAKKSTMVLFCRKSGKLDMQRKRVATTAKAGKESDDEEHARLLPNDTRNPDRGQRELQRKKLASSSSTRAERRLTSPLEKSPKALRNLSWNPKNRSCWRGRKWKSTGSCLCCRWTWRGTKKQRPRLQSQRPSAKHVSGLYLAYCLDSLLYRGLVVLQIDLRGFNFCFGFRHFSFGEKIFGMPGQVGWKDDDNEDALREHWNNWTLKGCWQYL